MKLTVKKFQELTTTELYEILKARAEIFIMEQEINYQDMETSIPCLLLNVNKSVCCPFTSV